MLLTLAGDGSGKRPPVLDLVCGPAVDTHLMAHLMLTKYSLSCSVRTLRVRD